MIEVKERKRDGQGTNLQPQFSPTVSGSRASQNLSIFKQKNSLSLSLLSLPLLSFLVSFISSSIPSHRIFLFLFLSPVSFLISLFSISCRLYPTSVGVGICLICCLDVVPIFPASCFPFLLSPYYYYHGFSLLKSHCAAAGGVGILHESLFFSYSNDCSYRASLYLVNPSFGILEFPRCTARSSSRVL